MVNYEPDDEDMVPGVSHGTYLAIRRMAKRLRDELRGDNHDAVKDREIEELSK